MLRCRGAEFPRCHQRHFQQQEKGAALLHKSGKWGLQMVWERLQTHSTQLPTALTETGSAVGLEAAGTMQKSNSWEHALVPVYQGEILQALLNQSLEKAFPKYLLLMFGSQPIVSPHQDLDPKTLPSSDGARSRGRCCSGCTTLTRRNRQSSSEGAVRAHTHKATNPAFRRGQKG